MANTLHTLHTAYNVCDLVESVHCTYILAVRKLGHLKVNIKTKMFDFEARIGWLANTLASQLIRTRALSSSSKSKIIVFMLRWPTFLTASIDSQFII